MNKKVIGGVVAVVVVGGGFAANSYLNQKLENSVRQAITKANEESGSNYGKISAEKIQCNVLLGNQCVIENIKVTDSDQPVEIGKLSVKGIRSLMASLESNKGKNLFTADSDVTIRIEKITSKNQSIADTWKQQDPDGYNLLTEPLKKSLSNNQLYVELKINNTVTKEQLVSDELFTVGLNDLPVAAKLGLAYTYHGDVSEFSDLQKFTSNEMNIFTAMNNLVVNKISLSLEQNKFMLTDIGHNAYLKEQQQCATVPDNAAGCLKLTHSGFPAPFDKIDHVMSEKEFQDAIVASLNDKNSGFYKMASGISEQFGFTAEETTNILNKLVKGGDTLSISLANKANTPLTGFGDVMMTQDPKLLRKKVDISVK